MAFESMWSLETDLLALNIHVESSTRNEWSFETGQVSHGSGLSRQVFTVYYITFYPQDYVAYTEVGPNNRSGLHVMLKDTGRSVTEGILYDDTPFVGDVIAYAAMNQHSSLIGMS